MAILRGHRKDPLRIRRWCFTSEAHVFPMIDKKGKVVIFAAVGRRFYCRGALQVMEEGTLYDSKLKGYVGSLGCICTSRACDSMRCRVGGAMPAHNGSTRDPQTYT